MSGDRASWISQSIHAQVHTSSLNRSEIVIVKYKNLHWQMTNLKYNNRRKFYHYHTHASKPLSPQIFSTIFLFKAKIGQSSKCYIQNIMLHYRYRLMSFYYSVFTRCCHTASLVLLEIYNSNWLVIEALCKHVNGD